MLNLSPVLIIIRFTNIYIFDDRFTQFITFKTSAICLCQFCPHIAVSHSNCTFILLQTLKSFKIPVQEEFEDTKGIIRIRKSKDRQHNGQKKKYKKDK